MTIAGALQAGRARLEHAGVETPGLDAEVLLRHALDIDRTAFFARLRDPLASEALASYEALVAARLAGTPVAYLTGEREFMGLPFAVGPGALIPRPETEILVEWALAWLRAHPGARVVDVGTGSGAIALSIAALLGPDWRGQIVAIDVSPQALEVAVRNRARFVLEDRVDLEEGSLLASVAGPIDLILANLPYLRPEQIAGNPELAAEPRLALDGAEEGLSLIARLLADAPRVLGPGGTIGLEIDPGQRDAVRELGEAAFPGADIRLLRDLAGFDRHVIIQTIAASLRR